MRVRLIRKLARQIDGIDLGNHDVGDVLDLPDWKAGLLLAEGWAVAASSHGDRTHVRDSYDEDDDISRAS